MILFPVNFSELFFASGQLLKPELTEKKFCMFLGITKNTGKPHIISYKTDDGTITWMYANDFFIRHDLSHYAIEKTLLYKTAFMGMLNKCMDLKDFEDKGKAPVNNEQRGPLCRKYDKFIFNRNVSKRI